MDIRAFGAFYEKNIFQKNASTTVNPYGPLSSVSLTRRIQCDHFDYITRSESSETGRSLWTNFHCVSPSSRDTEYLGKIEYALVHFCIDSSQTQM